MKRGGNDMRTVLDLSNVMAYKYFMEPANYCSVDLPIYIDFKPILDFVEKKVGSSRFEDILKDSHKKPSDFEGVNHKFLVKKDANYTFRSLQIANPYLYYLLVKEMTNPNNWEDIKKRFKDFRRDEIEVSSIPCVKNESDKSHKAVGVSSWWENMEQRSITLSLSFKYMFVTDITNCYPSIYTHTIAWALMDKEKAKSNRRKKELLGNIIDKYIQGMQYCQTNGLPQGSVLFDFIAEMVLGYADMKLASRLDSEKISEYKVLRYRDDYRIFSNNREELERIAFILQEVLADLNLQLNATKTILTENIIHTSIKKDKMAYLSNIPLYRKVGRRISTIASSLQQEALFIHHFANDFPNSGTLIKLLNIFSQRLTKRKKVITEPEVNVLIAIFTDIAISSPKAYKLLLHLISVLINKLSTTERRTETVRAIYEKLKKTPNIGELEVWMQHITYQMRPGINFSEPLCKIVAGEVNISLWNNDWVKDELKAEFPQNKICTNWIRDSFTPVINIDEVSLFDSY